MEILNKIPGWSHRTNMVCLFCQKPENIKVLQYGEQAFYCCESCFARSISYAKYGACSVAESYSYYARDNGAITKQAPPYTPTEFM